MKELKQNEIIEVGGGCRCVCTFGTGYIGDTANFAECNRLCIKEHNSYADACK